jgi:hypothetical protein
VLCGRNFPPNGDWGFAEKRHLCLHAETLN